MYCSSNFTFYIFEGKFLAPSENVYSVRLCFLRQTTNLIISFNHLLLKELSLLIRNISEIFLERLHSRLQNKQNHLIILNYIFATIFIRTTKGGWDIIVLSWPTSWLKANRRTEVLLMAFNQNWFHCHF